jgi:hypothetical protein
LKTDYRHSNRQQRKEIEMAKNQEKRIDKLAANLPAKERALAIIDAIRNEDCSTAQSLQSSTPRKSYSGPDAAVVDAVNVVENVSLRFDRAFYHMTMTLLAIGLSNHSENLPTASEMYSEMYGLVIGTELFAEKVGLSMERLLSFSIALEHNLIALYREDLKPPSDGDVALSEKVCEQWEKLWKIYAGNCPFTVAA